MSEVETGGHLHIFSPRAVHAYRSSCGHLLTFPPEASLLPTLLSKSLKYRLKNVMALLGLRVELAAKLSVQNREKWKVGFYANC